jgi:hypothetical protein
LRRIREETEKKPTRTSDIVNNAEIERMKGSTKIQTKDDKADTKKLYGEQLQQQQAAAKARKERMMEMDRERASKLPPTEQEVLTRKRDQGLLSKA